VTVNFSRSVFITGTPQLALSSGGTASYVSGSGTATLTFSYTVAAGQNASPLDEASVTALTLNGGSIVDGSGNTATLTLPAPAAAGSLGANKNIVIDTVGPSLGLATGVISGVVFADDNDNGVQNSSEAGIAGATVYLDINNNGRLDPGDVTTTTAADGTFTLSNLDPGTYSLRENAPLTVATTPASGTVIITLVGGDQRQVNFGLIATSAGLPVPAPVAIFDPPTSKTDPNAAAVVYIRGQYHSILNRDAEPAGLAFWVNVFTELQTDPQARGAPPGTDSYAVIAQAIWNSQEHRWREVESYYHNFLARDLDLGNPRDVADRQYWTNQFLIKGATEADVVLGFLTSPEYLYDHRFDASLATALNAGLLAGTATATDLQTWTAKLAALDARRSDLQNQVFDTPEAYKAALAANLGALFDFNQGAGVLSEMLGSDEYGTRTVSSFYSAFLHRPGSSAEWEWWLGLRDAAGMPLDLGTIAHSILASAEYRKNAVASEV
jgi:hypothetical protein